MCKHHHFNMLGLTNMLFTCSIQTTSLFCTVQSKHWVIRKNSRACQNKTMLLYRPERLRKRGKAE